MAKVVDVWKHRYYEHYFHVKINQQKYINKLCLEYIKGIYWVAKYYFEECPCYKWQYISNHAPFLSDISTFYRNNIKNINNVIFENAKPLKPLQQLLAVIPPKHVNILPKNYRYLVESDNSELADYYPINVKIDMINKDIYWKCDPELPIIDVNRIINATN